MKLRDIILEACKKHNYDPPSALVHLKEKEVLSINLNQPGILALNLVKKKP